MRRVSRRKAWFWMLAVARQCSPSVYRIAVLGTGFLAKTLCGDVFTSKRDPNAVLAEDLNGPGYELS